MTAGAVARALGGCKTGAGWIARCPAHDNRQPPAAGDGGSRQCIGSGQNLTADSTECRNIAQQATLLSLDSIVIGERHRKDMGDIAGLAANIAELGLLHPIVVRPDGRLIVGKRPLRGRR